MTRRSAYTLHGEDCAEFKRILRQQLQELQARETRREASGIEVIQTLDQDSSILFDSDEKLTCYDKGLLRRRREWQLKKV